MPQWVTQNLLPPIIFVVPICKMHKDITKTSTLENEILLRNNDDYLQDCLLNNLSETGIRESCVFSEIPSFVTTDNITVDIMHDLLEGICHVEICYCLKYFIFEKNIFLCKL